MLPEHFPKRTPRLHEVVHHPWQLFPLCCFPYLPYPDKAHPQVKSYPYLFHRQVLAEPVHPPAGHKP